MAQKGDALLQAPLRPADLLEVRDQAVEQRPGFRGTDRVELRNRFPGTSTVQGGWKSAKVEASRVLGASGVPIAWPSLSSSVW